MSSRNRMPLSIARQMRRADEMRDHREVAAPQRALAVEIRTVERALDSMPVAAEQTPAMVERESRRRLGAEVVRRHRPGEGRHAGVRERRELERGEVAVAEPSLAGERERREIDAIEQPRPAVAAAHRHRDVRRRGCRPSARSRRAARRRSPRSAASACVQVGSTTTRWPSAASRATARSTRRLAR